MEINIIPIVSGSLRDGSLLAGAKNVEERLIKRMEEGRKREKEREREREKGNGCVCRGEIKRRHSFNGKCMNLFIAEGEY